MGQKNTERYSPSIPFSENSQQRALLNNEAVLDNTCESVFSGITQYALRCDTVA